MDQLNANYNPNKMACKKTGENSTNTLQVNIMANNDNAHSTQHVASQNEKSPNNRDVNVAVMLNNFIENLAVHLPGSQSDTSNSSADRTTNKQPIAREKQIRPTSELLVQLQQALTMAPSPSTNRLFTQPTSLPAQNEIATQPRSNQSDKKFIRMNVRIERANFFSKLASNQNHENSTSNENSYAPSTYCTFEATALLDCPSNYRTYKTKTISKSYDPEWNEPFTVFLAADYLLNVRE